MLPLFIEPSILANSLLIKQLEQQRLDDSMPESTFKTLVFLDYRGFHYGKPDHVFEQHWLYLNVGVEEGWANCALDSLAHHFLDLRNQTVYVNLQHFSAWQSLLSRMSALPVLAAFLAKDSRCFGNRWEIIQNSLGLSGLLMPHDWAVEDYLEKQRLHETHLHLNGTTPAELCWLHALSSPKQAVKGFSEGYKIPEVKTLWGQIDQDLTPSRLEQRLQLARRLRDILLKVSDGWCIDSLGLEITASRGIAQLQECSLSMQQTPKMPLSMQYLWQEVNWMTDFIKDERLSKSRFLQRVFHTYLLIQNQFLHLTVQREDLYGFDQFQKYTNTEFREDIENCYQSRFDQLHASPKNVSQVGYLEGRFAPKNNPEGLERLLSNVLFGYSAYLKNPCPSEAVKKSYEERSNHLTSLVSELLTLEKNTPNKLRLALVCHFIKGQEDLNKNSYAYSELREVWQRQLNILLNLLERVPNLRRWFRGIDAAANELHTPPEVFAPICRVARYSGIEHTTYHVGEDFRHLLTGIRQIDDALQFLELRSGDRLGHCTAIGIHPEFWANTFTKTVIVPQGEWMLNLVFAWRVFSQSVNHQTEAHKAQMQAVALANKMFGATDYSITIELLDSAMGLRDVWPQYLFQACEPGFHHYQIDCPPRWKAEAKRAYDSLRANGINVLNLTKRWLSDYAVRERAGKLIQVDASHFDTASMISLQQAVMTECVNRRIVIETLPTSNVRISQYQTITDHHIFRWLGVGSAKIQGDPELLISLGSDDPGIFANNLKTEFYHLYATLRQHFFLSDRDALQMLAGINERGRIYRFHDRAPERALSLA